MSQNKLGDRDDLSIVSFDEICVDRARDLDKDTIHQVTSTAFTFTDLIRLLLQSRFVGVMKGFILSSGIVALIQYLWPSSVVCFDGISNIIRSFKDLSDITKLYTYFIEDVIPAVVHMDPSYLKPDQWKSRVSLCLDAAAFGQAATAKDMIGLIRQWTNNPEAFINDENNICSIFMAYHRVVKEMTNFIKSLGVS